MNTTTEENIKTTLKWVGETAQEGKEFILEQAPLYARELLEWEFMQGVIMAAVYGVILASLIKAGLLLFKGIKNDKPHYYNSDGKICLIAIICLISIFATIGLVYNTCQAIKAKTAPRVIIMEHLNGLTK